MRKLLFGFVFYFLAGSLFGQSPSILTDSVLYVTDHDEAFMMDKETKALVKTGPLALELKVGTAFSLSAVLIPDSYSFDTISGLGVGVGLEARYYYQMKELINKGLQSNNLSGNYFSLMPFRGAGFSFGQDSISTTRTTGLRITKGTQYRYKNWEYFDFRFEFEYLKGSNKDDSSLDFTGMRIRSKVNYGLAFGKKYDLDKEVDCSIIRCHLNRQSAFKIFRNQIFSLSRFSLFQEIGAILQVTNESGSFELDRNTVIGVAGARWYFKMAEKINNGESGNNLNGIYASASFKNTYANPFTKEENSGSFNIGLGHQREILGKLFVDIRMDLGPHVYGHTTNSWDIDFELGIGHLF